MPLKKIRKNTTPATREKIIGNNVGILHNANNKLPPGQRKAHPEIVAAALTAAGITKPKTKKK